MATQKVYRIRHTELLCSADLFNSDSAILIVRYAESDDTPTDQAKQICFQFNAEDGADEFQKIADELRKLNQKRLEIP